MAAMPEGRIASCGTDGEFMLWDRAKPGKGLLAEGYFAGAVLCALPDSRVAISGYNGQVHLWDPGEGTRPRLLGSHAGPVTAVVLLGDGYIASCGVAGEIWIWDPGNFQTDPTEMRGRHGRLNALGVVSDYIVGAGDDGTLVMWDRAGFQVDTYSRHSSWLTSVTSLRGRYLISGGTDSQIVVWELKGAKLEPISSASCSVRALGAGRTLAGRDCLAVAHADSGVSYWTLNVPSRATG
jgi:WD40 repeat protein